MDYKNFMIADMHLTLVQCLRRGIRNPRIVHSGLGRCQAKLTLEKVRDWRLNGWQTCTSFQFLNTLCRQDIFYRQIFGHLTVSMAFKYVPLFQGKHITDHKSRQNGTQISFIKGKYTTDYDNLPERYMIKKVTQVEWKSPNTSRWNVKHCSEDKKNILYLFIFFTAWKYVHLNRKTLTNASQSCPSQLLLLKHSIFAR